MDTMDTEDWRSWVWKCRRTGIQVTTERRLSSGQFTYQKRRNTTKNWSVWKSDMEGMLIFSCFEILSSSRLHCLVVRKSHGTGERGVNKCQERISEGFAEGHGSAPFLAWTNPSIGGRQNKKIWDVSSCGIQRLLVGVIAEESKMRQRYDGQSHVYSPEVKGKKFRRHYCDLERGGLKKIISSILTLRNNFGFGN
ncbi:hypothetical protein B0H13DRAFT_1913846 [Mycena leptocephala]|nr:hypothetical protein B0H13DRAFT_1913846 [Mycena leptocephala]